jgi:hypothetical protein
MGRGGVPSWAKPPKPFKPRTISLPPGYKRNGNLEAQANAYNILTQRRRPAKTNLSTAIQECRDEEEEEGSGKTRGRGSGKT